MIITLAFQYLCESRHTLFRHILFLLCMTLMSYRKNTTVQALFYEVLGGTDMTTLYHGDETFAYCSALQTCLYRSCTLRPHFCFSACRMVVTQVLLTSLAFILVYWHTVSSS